MTMRMLLKTVLMAVIAPTLQAQTTASGEIITWTAPSIPGTYYVTATSEAAPSLSTTWTVVVSGGLPSVGSFNVTYVEGPYYDITDICAGGLVGTTNDTKNTASLSGVFDAWEIYYSNDGGLTYTLAESGTTTNSVDTQFETQTHRTICFNPPVSFNAFTQSGAPWRARVKLGGSAWVSLDTLCQ